ncbi:MAG TPA: DegT/DnrJ/EryC1/StrS family aminotransferase [Candidatus Dadabacteria bacterium]|jgi:perosamine synthetase|nr:DegT/DnrJ/EryC1/StrS family aminotransferase [Candidatus Dadabacteria bacterium]
MIPFFVPEFTKDMENAAIDALRNEKFVMGESVFKFEEEFARYTGTKFAISVNSGNAALQLSLISLGITEKSKVITSTNSFVASANCILMTGAKPVLCDINYDDGNIDIKTTNEKPEAIIPVHIYGNPCDFDSIKSVSETHKAPIIEDACQAHGATFDHKKVGSIGDVGCFSFYPTKNMTVGGDGGMVTTNNEEIKKQIDSLRDNGRRTRTEHDKLGFTMRLNTVNAAIGRIQLQTLDEKNKRRRELASLYKKFLGDDCMLDENPKGTSVYHQIIIKHQKRDEIFSHLSKNNIGVAIHYPRPIHKQPLYENLGYSLPISEKFSNEVLSMPSFPQLKDGDVKIICEKINEVLV